MDSYQRSELIRKLDWALWSWDQIQATWERIDDDAKPKVALAFSETHEIENDYVKA